MKTLYYEVAGCEMLANMESNRIKVRFTDKEGNYIYIEIMGFKVTKKSSPKHRIYKNVGIIDICRRDGEHIPINDRCFEYNRTGILRKLNALFGCNYNSLQNIQKIT